MLQQRPCCHPNAAGCNGLEYYLWRVMNCIVRPFLKVDPFVVNSYGERFLGNTVQYEYIVGKSDPFERCCRHQGEVQVRVGNPIWKYQLRAGKEFIEEWNVCFVDCLVQTVNVQQVHVVDGVRLISVRYSWLCKASLGTHDTSADGPGLVVSPRPEGDLLKAARLVCAF